MKVYLRRITVMLVISTLVIAPLLMFAQLKFGSIKHAVAWLQGTRVWVSPQIVDVGYLDPGDHQIQVNVVNFQDQPVSLVGGTGQCKCLSFANLPQQIGPGESRHIDMIASVGGAAPKAPKNLYTFMLYTDAIGSERVVGSVRWLQK